jgi:hypothetical protein
MKSDEVNPLELKQGFFICLKLPTTLPNWKVFLWLIASNDSISDLDFNLAFSSPAEFLELSDDWEIIEKSTTVIKLKDVSGGNGGTDYLTFTKN